MRLFPCWCHTGEAEALAISRLTRVMRDHIPPAVCRWAFVVYSIKIHASPYRQDCTAWGSTSIHRVLLSASALYTPTWPPLLYIKGPASWEGWNLSRNSLVDSWHAVWCASLSYLTKRPFYPASRLSHNRRPIGCKEEGMKFFVSCLGRYEGFPTIREVKFQGRIALHVCGRWKFWNWVWHDPSSMAAP